MGTVVSVSGSREARQRRRTEALAGISGGSPVCACCNEKRVWALTFDHIAGGGNADRRENAGNPTVLLVRREWRASGEWPRHRYQVLCATCNHGRRVSPTGQCPHEKERQDMRTEHLEALKSYGKVFAAVVLGGFLAEAGGDVLAITPAGMRGWVAAGVAAVLPLIITALDPTDKRFGRKD